MPGRSERILPLALLVAVLLLFLPPGGMRDWWYPDEPDVALPAIEMQARGDWVVPTHNGVTWLDYPPLAYWGVRVVGALSGAITPWGTRVPMALFAMALVAATLWLGHRMGQPRRGLLAGVVLVATPTVWFHATNLQADLGFAMAIAGGLAFYHAGETVAGARAWWLRIAAFACFGVAILAKGPLGVLLPGLILTCWHLWNREWRRVLLLAPLALVSLMVASPWYLLLCDRLGAPVVWDEIVQQNFNRFGDARRGHGGKGVLYYLTRLPGDLGVWTLFIIPALWQGFRTRRADRSWRLLAVWLLAPLIFFTLASTKRNVYLLPVFPALALLVADWLSRSGDGWEERVKTWGARLSTGALVVVGLVLVVSSAVWDSLPLPTDLPAGMPAALRLAALVLGGWLLVSAAWSLRLACIRQTDAWWALAASMTVTYVLVMWLVFPALDRVRSYRPAAHWLVERVPAGGEVGFFSPGRERQKRPAWLCHLEGRRLRFLRTPADTQAWLMQDPSRLVLSTPTLAATVPQATVKQAWTISTDSWVVLGVAP